jgi:hypothetical protein
VFGGNRDFTRVGRLRALLDREATSGDSEPLLCRRARRHDQGGRYTDLCVEFGGEELVFGGNRDGECVPAATQRSGQVPEPEVSQPSSSRQSCVMAAKSDPQATLRALTATKAQCSVNCQTCWRGSGGASTCRVNCSRRRRKRLALLPFSAFRAVQGEKKMSMLSVRSTRRALEGLTLLAARMY